MVDLFWDSTRRIGVKLFNGYYLSMAQLNFVVTYCTYLESPFLPPQKGQLCREKSSG
jgi:hypothetical protein